MWYKPSTYCLFIPSNLTAHSKKCLVNLLFFSWLSSRHRDRMSVRSVGSLFVEVLLTLPLQAKNSSSTTGSAVKRRWTMCWTMPLIEGLSCNFHRCHILQQRAARRKQKGGGKTLTAAFSTPGPENTTFVTGSRLFAIKLNKIRLLNDFFFCFVASLEVKCHHLHTPQDANLWLLLHLHKFGSTGWI